MAKKTTKPKTTKVTGEPVKKKKTGGAQKGNKNREIYTLAKAKELFEGALKILQDDNDLITETELMVQCKYQLSLPISSYTYLRDEKFKAELEDIKREINSLLESRVMKSKDMYPGIAAMTLKNKHGWRDEKQLDITAEIGVKNITDQQLSLRIAMLERKLLPVQHQATIPHEG